MKMDIKNTKAQKRKSKAKKKNNENKKNNKKNGRIKIPTAIYFPPP